MLRFIIVISSYFIGAIPFGYLIAKTKHIDIRKVGSGNIGTTNVHRTLGIWYGLLVGLCDIGKGILPTFLAMILFHNQLVTVCVALVAVLGHIFPVYLGFKGGKGVATFAGTLIVIIGIKIFLLLFLIWIVCLYITKTMSITNLVCTLLVPILLIFTLHSSLYAYYSTAVAVVIWWAHRGNIERIRKGKEKKLTLPIIHFKKV